MATNAHYRVSCSAFTLVTGLTVSSWALFGANLPVLQSTIQDPQRIQGESEPTLPSVHQYVPYDTSKQNDDGSVGFLAPDSLELIGRWNWGISAANVPFGNSGDMVLIGNGWQLQIVSYSKLDKPVVFGEVLLTGVVFDIFVLDSIAYVAHSNGMDIVDLTDPESPQLVGSWVGHGTSFRVVAAGTVVYLCGYSSTSALDVSDPSSIQLLDRASNWGEICNGMALVGNYLYVSTYEGPYIDIYDVSNPFSIKSVDYEFGPWDGLTDLFHSGDNLYVSTFRSVHIFALDEPARPVETGVITQLKWVKSIAADDTLLYLTQNYDLYIFSVSDPSNPRVLGKEEFPWIIPVDDLRTDVSIMGDHAFVSFQLGLWSMNISSPELPHHESVFWTAWHTPWEGIFIQGAKAYLPYGFAGVWEVDVVDPTTPEEGRHLVTLPDAAYNVMVEDEWLYVVADSQLQIVGMSQPDSFSVTSRWPSPLPLHRGVVKFPLAFLVSKEEGFFILDISSPESPQEIIYFPQVGLNNLMHNDSYVYAATLAGLNVIDITDPYNPQLVSSWPGTVVGSTNTGDIVYALHLVGPDEPHIRRLTALDLKSPQQSLIELGFVDLPMLLGLERTDMDKNGSILYIAGYTWILGIDVSDPTSMELVLEFDPLQQGIRTTILPLEVEGPYIYTGAYGLSIFQYSKTAGVNPPHQGLPSEVRLFTNYPNPFNESTWIQYDLAAQGDVSLDIFDLVGGKVINLVKSEKPAGSHRISWDGRHEQGNFAPSGVYLCRLQVGKTAKVRKMVLLR